MAAPPPLTLQAGAVAIAGRAVLLRGAPGSGKSTLAAALIDRGAVLVGDDGVVLSPRAGALWAAPPPAIRGLLELRNVGLVRFPVGEAPVALLLHLTHDAPRYVEQAARETLAGHAIPALAFDPAIPAAAIRVEHALRLHGLPRRSLPIPPFAAAKNGPGSAP